MRGVVLATLLVATATARAYDHAGHDGKLAAAGLETPACTRCHRVDAAHRPAPARHDTCYSAGCHVRPARFLAAARGQKVCVVCHPTSPSPTQRSRDFSLALSHASHPGCPSCHEERRPPVHGRCARCHAPGARTAPGLDQCTGCHRPIAGRDTTPHLTASAYNVRRTFDHRAHRGRPGGADCLSCHDAVLRATGEVVPAPTMTRCGSCHDGKQAFAALGPTCRRCHARVDADSLPSDAPAAPYEHAAHAARGLKAGCQACHGLDAQGEPRPAAASHAPCSDAACHASEFHARTPRVCGACHVGTEPWRALGADAPRRVRTEFGVELSHAGHLVAHPAACESCHTGIRGGPEMRLGRGHATCSGAGCHDRGAAPALTACDACHKLGLLVERDRRRRDDPWSVAARFHHDAGHAGPCASCHQTVAAARTVDVIETPKKAACTPCHDGKQAFKLTGHSCARCHGQPQAEGAGATGPR